jgi:DNA polymerase-1
MVAQRISCTDYPIGLDFICSVHTDIPYYKDEGKKWFKFGGAMSQFWQYNAMDTIATAAAHPKQIEDLINQKNIEVYDRQRRIIPPLVYMMEHGIKVDLEGMLEERVRVEAQRDKLEEQLHQLTGKEIVRFEKGERKTFYNSPKQVMDYFYREKGLKPYLKRNKEKKMVPTSDDDAMRRVSRLGYKEASIILQLRSLSSKTLGTYLAPEKVSKDGRYRPSYNPVGARTGRLSSSENIFDEGGNMQNWPHKLLRFLVADEGYVYYSYDLSQAENRIVAYVGRVLEMIRCFEESIDVHSLVGANIANRATGQKYTWKDIKAQDKEDIPCPIGDGTKTWRFYGKRTGHASNYDMGVNTFALQNELKQNDAKFLLESYHQLFPEIRANYQSMIRAMLLQNRTVTNPFGRNRTFMGQWGDDMFKAAYAQLPQSTVADMINEWGLAYIYYNQDLFAPVELACQVHDSVGMFIPLSVPWIEHARMLSLMKAKLETPLSWHGRQFSIPADLTMGYNLCKDPVYDDIELSAEDRLAGKKGKLISSAAEFKAKDIPSDLTIFAHKLETAWTELNKAVKL